jgi:hypothetical protein
MTLEAIVVYVDRFYIARHDEHAATWRGALRGSTVSVAQELTVQTDAALVSASACDRYGCKAGSSEATLGRMYLFDTKQFGLSEPPNAPRYFISNAVWRKDPPLLDAIEKRLALVQSIVDEHNAAHQAHQERIRSITIYAAVLGGWNDYPEKVQMEGIAHAAALLRRWMAPAL